jgi:hypothetical protein
MLIGVVLALVAAVPAPVAAYNNTEVDRIKTLTASQYTNGVEKSFLVTWSFSNCNQVFADVEIRFYYDILNAAKIRITKAVTKYYIGGITKKIWGGILEGSGTNDIVRIGAWRGDYDTVYFYNGQPRDPDGYAQVGTYTHSGPATLNAFNDGTGPYAYFMKSGVTAETATGSCTTGWMDLFLTLRW